MLFDDVFKTRCLYSTCKIFWYCYFSALWETYSSRTDNLICFIIQGLSIIPIPKIRVHTIGANTYLQNSITRFLVQNKPI